MPEEYKGEERRMSCKDCVSHREHAAQIKSASKSVEELKQDQRETHKDMWAGIKDKVPYRHFIAAIGLIVTVIGIATTVNWSTMNKVLDSNHRVEIQVTKIESEVKNINRRMNDYTARLGAYEKEHDFFRKAIMSLMESKGKNEAHGGQ